MVDVFQITSVTKIGVKIVGLVMSKMGHRDVHVQMGLQILFAAVSSRVVWTNIQYFYIGNLLTILICRSFYWKQKYFLILIDHEMLVIDVTIEIDIEQCISSHNHRNSPHRNRTFSEKLIIRIYLNACKTTFSYETKNNRNSQNVYHQWDCMFYIYSK